MTILPLDFNGLNLKLHLYCVQITISYRQTIAIYDEENCIFSNTPCGRTFRYKYTASEEEKKDLIWETRRKTHGEIKQSQQQWLLFTTV